MIISHEHRFIFFKTRKTAGTSIELALSAFCGEKDVITQVSRDSEGLRDRGPQRFFVPLSHYTSADWLRILTKGRRPRYVNHVSADQVRSRVPPAVWKRYLKFCFERNPWDKAISLYLWRTRDCHPRPPLLTFLRSVNEDDLSNSWIYTIDGRLAVDHVGRYENLKAEMDDISATLNLPTCVDLPITKQSPPDESRLCREAMGEEERDLIMRACSWEISRFEYVF
jgi:hypothetical protein